MRFNFRGVGRSEGEHTKGEKESQEILGALDLIKAWPDVRGKIGLTGYSFGSGVILNHSELYKEVNALALVSPSLSPSGTPLRSEKLPPKTSVAMA